MVDMNHSELWAQGSWCYEQLRVVNYMKYYGSWAQGSRYYEQLRVVVDMNDSWSWAQGTSCYKQLRVVDTWLIWYEPCEIAGC